MSKRFITILTLTAVMIHVLLGCCWHHSHEGAGIEASVCSETEDTREIENGSKLAARATLNQLGHCCACTHGDDSRPNDQRQQSPCDASDCVFYSAANAALQAVVKKAGWPSLAIDCRFARTHFLKPRTASSPMSIDSHGERPPVRANIQVWLV